MTKSTRTPAMADRVKLTEAQWRALSALNEHAGTFKRGYGKSAAALARKGFAKRKFVSDDGIGVTAKFAITPAGRALLASDAGKGR